MERERNIFLHKNRWIVVSYLVWTFIHILLLLNGENRSGFWPFDGIKWNKDYGAPEFFVYQLLPILIFVTIKLVGKDIEEAILKIKIVRKKNNLEKKSISLEKNYNLAGIDTSIIDFKRSKKTKRHLKIYWFVWLSYVVTLKVINTVYSNVTGSLLFNYFDIRIESITVIWNIIYMFIFGHIGVKSSNFLNEKSPNKEMLAFLWWLIGFISIWFLTIPIVLQNSSVKKKEIAMSKINIRKL